jgi:hypothetical protein
MAAVEGRVARFKRLPVPTADGLGGAVGAGGRDLLSAHGHLHETLNAAANAAKHAADEQQQAVSRQEGRVQEAVAAAARRLGDEPTDALRERLEFWSGDRDSLAAARDQRRVEAADVRTRRLAREQEEERRALLARSHGEEPSIAGEEEAFGAALAARQERQKELDAALDLAEQCAATTMEGEEREKGTLEEAREAWTRWSGFAKAVSAALGDPQRASELTLHQGRLAVLEWDQAHEAMLGLGEAVRSAVQDATEADQARKAEAEAQEAAAAAGAQLDAADEAKRAAEEALRRATERRDRWRETARLIGEPLPGPEADEVNLADAAVDRAAAELATADAAAAFREVLLQLRREEELLAWLEDLEQDLRDAAGDSWLHLGDVVTEELGLPWLRLKGMDMELVYDRATKRLATEETPEERREVRLLDDKARVSTAELHEAMLHLMLDRRRVEPSDGGRPPVIIFPWDYERPSAIAALDDERKARFAAAVIDAGLVIFAERPRRTGEPEEVHIVRVEPLREAA